MGNIIIKEDVTPKPVPVNLVEEAVVLPGKPLTYDDLTPEQIEELQRPAIEAAEKANEAVTSIGTLETQIENKESEREASETLRKEAETQRAEAETSRQQKFSQMEITVNSLVEETT